MVSTGRLEKSLFRYGLDHLADKLFDGVIDSLEASRLLLLLFCPFDWLVFESEGQKVTNDYGFLVVDF